MITVENSTVRLSGTVNNSTVPALLTELSELPAEPLTLDLSAVELVDSAAVSLLLSLKRQRANAITVINVPANLRSLIQLYDVDELLCTGAQ